MIPVVTPDEMRAIDAAAPEPVDVLIARAGEAVARVAVDVLGGVYGRTVAVLAGPGNNGADGRVAADRLRDRGVSVRVFDALDPPSALADVDLVIDAAFGSGFRDSWQPPDTGSAPVLAVDVPTGLDGTTGAVAGGTLRAAATVTFAAARPGHVLGGGPDVVGRLHVADIGLDVGGAAAGIVESSDVAAWLPARQRTAHKWTDAVRVVAGGPGMTGAGFLAAEAAQRSGAGMVMLSSPGIDAAAPVEVVDRRVPPFDWAESVLADLHRFHALIVGPGLGREEYTVPSVVRAVLDSVVPVVVDGDGLFAMSWNDEGTPAFLREREVPTVLTPHDGEFGLLMGARPGDDRLAAAHGLAAVSGAIVLLKGPTTVVASPDGSTLLVANGDERLATAGSGDVLAGIIGALLARGVPVFEAAAAGAWIHADAAARRRRDGFVAGDLSGAIAETLEALEALR
ncbi:MAG: NAD(P)H-hydrate dehydratase [Ilumatobacter sp.]|uniref:NAD(P)H-hydrate dehydratase n=1 Tax=Ilumatobacter sp. TaxID=1967498 RepID=UPI00260D1985|nr:NAD(P)H-hydrate dehydratase [Ilumatobacter sp.]MDJ0771004.1 NAD(P)H-hydrate dehydratase [Ilumatobacter sp.]